MANTITCRIDRELDAAIRLFAEHNKLTRSQAIRELLRQAATDASPLRRGWHEGFAAGHAEYQKGLYASLSGSTAPE